MIERLHARYADGVNRRRADLLAELFDPAAVWDLGPHGTIEGRDAIAAWLGELFTHWATIFHTVHSSIVDIADDGATAQGRLWFTEFGIRDGAPRGMAGVVHDRYACGADGEWRFVWRHHDITHRVLDGTHEALPFPSGFDDWVR